MALSQHGSKAGSNDMPVNGKSFAHAGPESTKTAAEDCRCEGCIRHRLTLAHQDRPKPQQGQVARGGWSSMGKSKGKSDASLLPALLPYCDKATRVDAKTHLLYPQYM